MSSLEALPALGILGALIIFLINALSGREGPKAEETGGVGVSNGSAIGDGVIDAFSFPAGRKLTKGEVHFIAAEVSKIYGGRVETVKLITFAEIESSFRPWVERHEPRISDYSVGLMQTLVRTANEMYDRGYNRFARPTRENLKNPVLSMYYGAAYIDWLQKTYRGESLEWYVRAYNGGAGHNNNSMTTNYWNKWRRAFENNGGGTGVGIRFG